MRYERPPPPGFCIRQSDPVAACLGRVEGWRGRDCGLSSVRGDAGETGPRSPTDPPIDRTLQTSPGLVWKTTSLITATCLGCQGRAAATSVVSAA